MSEVVELLEVDDDVVEPSELAWPASAVPSSSSDPSDAALPPAVLLVEADSFAVVRRC